LVTFPTVPDAVELSSKTQRKCVPRGLLETLKWAGFEDVISEIARGECCSRLLKKLPEEHDMVMSVGSDLLRRLESVVLEHLDDVPPEIQSILPSPKITGTM